MSKIKQCECVRLELNNRCKKCFQYQFPLKIIKEISRKTITDRRRNLFGYTLIDVILKCPFCEEYRTTLYRFPHICEE